MSVRAGTIPECGRCHGALRIPGMNFTTGEPQGTCPCPGCTHRLSLCGVITNASWHEPVACAFFPGHDGAHSWASLPALDPRASVPPGAPKGEQGDDRG